MNPQSVTAPTRLRQTNAKYENNSNGYSTFLNEKAELPRLSILDNYKQIMRIMTNSYNKGGEYQNKFKNRMEKDIIHDEEYQKFKEEETNSKKMSTILRSLNTTNYKKKLPAAASAQPKYKMAQNAGMRKSMPPTANRTSRDLQAINEEEIY